MLFRGEEQQRFDNDIICFFFCHVANMQGGRQLCRCCEQSKLIRVKASDGCASMSLRINLSLTCTSDEEVNRRIRSLEIEVDCASSLSTLQ